MQFGFSSYSFYQYLRVGRMTLVDVIDWIEASEATHMEIATVSLSPEISNDTSDLPGDPALVAAIAARAAATGVTLSNLVVPGDLLGSPEETAATMASDQIHHGIDGAPRPATAASNRTTAFLLSNDM